MLHEFSFSITEGASFQEISQAPASTIGRRFVEPERSLRDCVAVSDGVRA